MMFLRNFLSRYRFGEERCSTCDPHFCSMKITEDAEVRGGTGISEDAALRAGLESKAAEFSRTAELCAKADI